MSGEVSIPEEAIEAACFELNEYASGPREHFRERWGDQAELALEAAAPLIVAEALSREADHIHSVVQAYGFGPNDDPPGHSIAGALCDVAIELRERASVLRGEGQQGGE